MKIKQIKITGEKLTVIKPLAKKLQYMQSSLNDLAYEVGRVKETLFKKISSLYPEADCDNASINFKKFVLTYTVEDQDDETLRNLKQAKEKAIKGMEFELASKLRFQERALIEKIKNQKQKKLK